MKPAPDLLNYKNCYIGRACTRTKEVIAFWDSVRPCFRYKENPGFPKVPFSVTF